MKSMNIISLDTNLMILDDEKFLENKTQRQKLYKGLKYHPLWQNSYGPGLASYPHYPKSWRSLTTKISGLSHYHDEMYWSWLIAFAGKIAHRYGDFSAANLIFSSLQQLAIRDDAISEIYSPAPNLPKFKSKLYKSSSPFSWGSAMTLESLYFYKQHPPFR